MVKDVLLLVVLAFAAAGCAILSHETVPGPAQTSANPLIREEAIQALQAATSETFLNESIIQDAARAINLVRRRFPEVDGISAEAGRSSLILHFSQAAWHQLEAMNPAVRAGGQLSTTGIPVVDSISLSLGVTGFTWPTYGLRSLEVHFPRPPNVPIIARMYAALTEVDYAGHQIYFGLSTGIRTKVEEDAIMMYFWRGWGDCLSGCIYGRRFVFRYDRPTGTLTKLEETGDPLPTSPDA